ncbi:CD63 antigen [Acromyrmex echinatior]|uniref:CD63 antigen n=1 Tax=Acromyrmex echinatior TaxID=103372 RepID=F4WBA4_ACREC|nr:CD63 antigen [Acromyrmex echinatior]
MVTVDNHLRLELQTNNEFVTQDFDLETALPPSVASKPRISIETFPVGSDKGAPSRSLSLTVRLPHGTADRLYISGIGIIVAGAWVLADVGEFDHFMENRIMAPPIVLIVAGSIVFAIAFLGCYGAIKEHYNMLIAFAVALLIIFVIELAVGIAAAVFKNDFSMAMKNTLKESMKNYTESDKQAWNNIQKKLQCCGVDGPRDWIIPSSCCDETLSICQIVTANTEGCFSKLEMRVQNSATILIGVGIGIAFVEASKVLIYTYHI